MVRFIIFLSLVLGLVACGQSDPDATGIEAQGQKAVAAAKASNPYLNTRAGVAYVGDDACFSCHEDLWRGYQTHGMAQSYYPLTPENAVETFPGGPIEHAASGYTYRTYAQDGQYFQEEYRLDAAGRKVHSLVRRMDYVVGSGTAARTYLTDHQGRLYELPLTWYTQRKKWDFSPGYRERNSRFERLIPDGCMACHNSYPETVPFVQGKYDAVPQGIGCERCHGPGDLHVAERLATPEPSGEIDYTIVNPKHLALDRQLDVCQQCHLHGTISVERDGVDPFGYRPSQPLSAHRAVFSFENPASSEQKISVISHADRMQKSACFIETAASDKPMTCVTCHNPHEGFREKGPVYFNNTCLTCHPVASLQARLPAPAKASHTSEGLCFSCHMPKVEAEDAPHSSFTDHWIRVVTEIAREPLATGSNGLEQLVPYFAPDDAATPEAEAYKGMAYVMVGRQQGSPEMIRQGVALLEKAVPQEKQNGMAHLLLGLGHMLLEQPQEAIPPLEQAIKIDPKNPEFLYGLADAYKAAGRDPAATDRLYQRALSIQPQMAQTRVNYGLFLETQGRLDEAIRAYEQAAEEQSWLDVAYYNLGTAYLQKQDFAAAERMLLQAVALNPDYDEALGNLGLLYASQGQSEKARVWFERALTAAPDDPTALGNLGTFYLNEEAYPKAIDLLTRAVEINPRYLTGLVNLSLAHFRRDDLAAARRYAQKALEIDPGNEMARQLLQASS